VTLFRPFRESCRHLLQGEKLVLVNAEVSGERNYVHYSRGFKDSGQSEMQKGQTELEQMGTESPKLDKMAFFEGHNQWELRK
jgi:hypothetical protein